jgi:hypothetical protein
LDVVLVVGEEQTKILVEMGATQEEVVVGKVALLLMAGEMEREAK